MTTPRLRWIGLDTFDTGVRELPRGATGFTVGHEADWPVPSKRQARFTRDGARWTCEGVALTHGQTIALSGGVLVFLDRPAPRHAGLEAAIDQSPDDRARTQVWRDWSLEQTDGDALDVLEGLGAFVETGALELETRDGLIRAARVRCVPQPRCDAKELTARLVSLTAARWLSALTIDLSRWERESPDFLRARCASLLRALSEGPHLPRLEALSLGYSEGEVESAAALGAFARLEGRSVKLAGTGFPMRTVTRAWLEVLHVPAGLDFHAPALVDGRVPLDEGLWVGGSTPGQLRALAPGAARQAAVSSFIVSADQHRWSLLPLDASVRLNGRQAQRTRLLPGDRLDTAEGAQFRFAIAPAP